jgi:hypothetical protein
MSNLTNIDKRYLEKNLRMESGYVLDFSDSTFAEFFNRHKINIHGSKYQKYGTSKAKKLRAFWDLEPDFIVANVLAELLDSYQADCDLNGRDLDAKLLSKNRQIIEKLKGKTKQNTNENIDTFLDEKFLLPSIQNLPIELQVAKIIEDRLGETNIALKSGAYLSVIFLCGSILEAVLLGAAQKEPAKFNSSQTSPKTSDGKVKQFHEWSLSQFIDTAYDVGLLKLDVKKFSHGLRDFRNYIHPYEQMASGFKPDEHTAKVCFQVLKAALANIAGERQ